MSWIRDVCLNLNGASSVFVRSVIVLLWFDLYYLLFYHFCLVNKEFHKRKSVEVGVFREGGHFSANISSGSGQFPATPFKVERLEISLFRMVLRYWQRIISLCHNTRIWQTDGQTELQQQYCALHLHYMQSDDINDKTVKRGTIKTYKCSLHLCVTSQHGTAWKITLFAFHNTTSCIFHHCRLLPTSPDILPPRVRGVNVFDHMRCVSVCPFQAFTLESLDYKFVSGKHAVYPQNI